MAPRLVISLTTAITVFFFRLALPLLSPAGRRRPGCLMAQPLYATHIACG
jgi:hypothetical protein